MFQINQYNFIKKRSKETLTIVAPSTIYLLLKIFLTNLQNRFFLMPHIIHQNFIANKTYIYNII